VKKKESTLMTRGIMVSVNHKRELYLNSKYSNDHIPKDFYKRYYKISRRISTSKTKLELLATLLKLKQVKTDKEEIPIISCNGL
jgi:hypothetical protein